MTHYKLIVGHDFSLADETNCDSMTDYFPGIWAIGSQKAALRYSKEILARGDTISVTDYDNPRYHALANSFIKELGLSQPLFEEPAPLTPSVVTKSGVPTNLSQLKKFLTVGKKIHMKNYFGEEIRERDTSVLEVKTASLVVEKTLGTGTRSWMDFGKASEWIFDNDGATHYYLDRDGKNLPQTRIEYI